MYIVAELVLFLLMLIVNNLKRFMLFKRLRNFKCNFFLTACLTTEYTRPPKPKLNPNYFNDPNLLQLPSPRKNPSIPPTQSNRLAFLAFHHILKVHNLTKATLSIQNVDLIPIQNLRKPALFPQPHTNKRVGCSLAT